MKRLNTIVIVGAKIFEVAYWLMGAVMLLSLIVSVAMPGAVSSWAIEDTAGLNIRGFMVEMADGTETVLPRALAMASLTGVLSCGLMAMVFRNIYLIFRTARGTTWFSKGQTPFQPDIIRMVREIGIFCISLPLVQLAMSVIGRLVIGTATAEISVSLDGIVMGIIVLCLSQFFAYGMQLQEDVDGLI
ncbi:MAG: hypothetical protein Q4F79_04650 [Eubacteriales bacterium]|nr:hypothetical protein [Eubacteriales bacterium]